MTDRDVSLIGEGKSKSMSEREQFQRFKAYMDAPCHELDERDGGRNDPHRLAFAEWCMPQEFLLWMWQAAEKASRCAALEEILSLSIAADDGTGRADSITDAICALVHGAKP